MTAPGEVFVVIAEVDGEPYGVFSSERRAGKYDRHARYLRADLTCGECKLGIEDDDGCPHIHAVDLDYAPHHDSPACMTFVPKEKR